MADNRKEQGHFPALSISCNLQQKPQYDTKRVFDFKTLFDNSPRLKPVGVVNVLGCLLFLSMAYAIFMDKMAPRAGIFQYTVSETK